MIYKIERSHEWTRMHTDKIKEYLLLREIVLLTAENAENTEVVRR